MEERVWERAWSIELNEWDDPDYQMKGGELISRVMKGPAYSVWWQMADCNQSIMKRCEVMVKLLCKASALKDDDCRLKSQPFGSRMCIRCELGAPENTNHMVMQCPANEDSRRALYEEISLLAPQIVPQEYLNTLLGKEIDGWEYEHMLPVWEVSSKWVTKMYYDTLRARQGVG